MAALSIQVPYPVFYDRDGQPLDNGNIYIGAANLDPVTNPIQVYYDEALTIPASQPLKTSNGYVYRNGTPTQLYVDGANFSILVNDSKNTLVYSFPDGTGVGVQAASIIYNEGSVGAVDRTVASRLQDIISVKDFGAVGDGVADDTAAIQYAINTGKAIFFPDGTYAANGLFSAANNQKFFGSGRLIKNGNGALLTVTNSGVILENLYFSGTSYTGNNIAISGTSPTLINVTSENAAGRALVSTKGSTTVLGGHYRTSDSTATGFDIELGDGAVSSLYNFIYGMSTNQSIGGILCQAADLYMTNCQVYKLSTTGANSAKVYASRIIGPSSLSGSDSAINGCNLADNVTINAGAGKCSITNNNYAVGVTVTNNGNGNNYIDINTSTGTKPIIQYGGSTSNAKIAFDQDYFGFSKDIYITTAIRAYSANTFDSGTIWPLISVGAAGQVTFGTNQSFVSYLASNTHQFIVGGTPLAAIDSASLRPEGDGITSCGTAAKRWSVVYATTGTINTSDARFKQQIRSLTDAEKAVALKCKSLLRAFKFNDAVAEKGDDARWHFGVMAQDIIAAFQDEGLNAFEYAVVCHDTWEAKPAIIDDDGNIVSNAQDAGETYGIRYEELLAFILGAI